eukprot:CAMPEP_0206141542 /NCGR_PEP_ID=MMETSP1473-20131121/13331_1 /ASSEMBLY_ACC=CAM_ASM_001109 /TAXON_ID=1461547 /ORGANISM="Stichococcus sp, Strain RCC1054" /LENGTH=58 /DNA_ID=CAMNT_0053536155 /DNA_START=89 /DNA_END=265 /DNA_ORIENTATION=+
MSQLNVISGTCSLPTKAGDEAATGRYSTDSEPNNEGCRAARGRWCLLPICAEHLTPDV